MILLDRSTRRSAGFSAWRPFVASCKAEIQRSIAQAERRSIWVSYASDLTAMLVSHAATLQAVLGVGVILHALEPTSIPALSALFRRVVFGSKGQFLPAEELATVLRSERAAQLFVGGCVDHGTRTITFWRGDLHALTVPFSTFAASGAGVAPDFESLSIDDGGQTIRLGAFEAAVDAILYEFDAQYRRRRTQARLLEDRSFGAALQRLRKQRGLRREDFEPDVAAKTVARIEQGKVTRLRPATLAALAKRLSVEPQEIATF